MKLKRLPIGIQSFRKLREGDYLYVDKHNIRELYCANHRQECLCYIGDAFKVA